ncbi:methyl-accepting chemotaxis protein, partial [Merismopedia glauca]
MLENTHSRQVTDPTPDLSETFLDTDELEFAPATMLQSEAQDISTPTRPSSWWKRLGFKSQLALLLITTAAIPAIAITQGIVWSSQKSTRESLLQTVETNAQGFLNDYVLWLKLESISQSRGMAEAISAAKIDLQNRQQVATNRSLIESLLRPVAHETQRPDTWKSFRIVTDAQGKTVAQYVKLHQDFPLGTAAEQRNAALESLTVPTGIDLGNWSIVQDALKLDKPLEGVELLDPKTLNKLGLQAQTEIKSLSPSYFPQAESNKTGMVAMAVHPIKVNGKIVGLAIVGTLLNRGNLLTDTFQENYGSVTSVFAQDLRVASSITEAKTEKRLLGDRAPKDVVQTVLLQGKPSLSENNQIAGKTYVGTYIPLYDHQQQINPDQAKPIGMAFVGTPPGELDATINNLQMIGYGIGGIILLLTGLIAIPLANRFSRPLQRLSVFAQELGAGKQGTRLVETDRQDEIGVLSRELNHMAVQLERILADNREATENAQVLSQIVINLGQYPQQKEAFNQSLQLLRQQLAADRVIIYRFDEETWQGTIIAESVGQGWPAALGVTIYDPCFKERYLEKYRQGGVKAFKDIHQAGLTECHLQQLEPFSVKSNLVVPILRGSRRNLAGLLIAHQCSAPREWQQKEIIWLEQVATQVGFAIDRANLIDQQRQTKDTLQRRAIELLTEVDPVSRGDLTIRAKVTEDEIGTVADSYNATIGSLRRIVIQVQQAAEKLANTTNSNEDSVRELSKEALRQAEEIATTLDCIQDMSSSINAVTSSAQEAQAAVKEAAEQVAEGDLAMNKTVDGILAIRETVAQTSKKVKRLGESSQKISKVVNLISTFAEQTNLLALNAAIEAANAGEQGRGFAVVAERVRALARQSAQATAEIETLVTEIQTETNEVVAAMESGTEQVVMGTKLVDETRQSLNKISAVSDRISHLVEAIATSASEQSQTSAVVSQTVSDVAAISSNTLKEATQVSAAFKELLAIAQELQTS